MKKILSTIAIACLSFSSFAESYFVKVADNEYVLQHGEKSENLGINKSGYGAIAPVDAIYTPTHIFTYPDGNPAHFRNIQKINYTESHATFYKDMKTRKCCIDILDNRENENKCRIIGVNGHDIGSFEVYEVAGEANSFTDNKQRLIYVDHTGLYIVSEKENPVETISKNYFKTGSFNFKGEIIEISAIDGNRKVPKCTFKWPYGASVSFEESVAYSMAEFVPFMEQIKKIIGVMPEKAPPTWDAAKKRMAKILNIPEGVLIIEEGVVKIRNGVGFSSIIGSKYGQLLSFVPLARSQEGREVLRRDRIFMDALHNDANYTFDTSTEAKQRRREIALKPWDEE